VTEGGVVVESAKELVQNDCFWKRCHFMGNVNGAKPEVGVDTSGHEDCENNYTSQVRCTSEVQVGWISRVDKFFRGACLLINLSGS
jgi:hypothetical protein